MALKAQTALKWGTLTVLLLCLAMAEEGKKVDLTAQEIMDKAAEAACPKVAASALRTLVIRTHHTQENTPGSVTLIMTWKAPDFIHMVVDGPAPGQRVEMGRDAEGYWMRDPQGTRELPPKLRGHLQECHIPFLPFGKGARKASEYLGREKMGDSDAYKMGMKDSEGNTIDQWYDARTFLLLKMAASTVDRDACGENWEPEIEFRDYRDVGGAKIPFEYTLLLPGGGIMGTVRVESAKANVPVDEKSFGRRGSPSESQFAFKGLTAEQEARIEQWIARLGVSDSRAREEAEKNLTNWIKSFGEEVGQRAEGKEAPPPKALAPEQAAQMEAWLARIEHGDDRERDAAAKTLNAWVNGLEKELCRALFEACGKQKDPESRARLDKIMEKLRLPSSARANFKFGSETAALQVLQALCKAEATYAKTVKPGCYALKLTDLMDYDNTTKSWQPMIPSDLRSGEAHGYLIRPIPNDENGIPYDPAKGYAFCAYPSSCNRFTRQTLIVNQEGYVYLKDTGGGAMDRWPARDPTLRNWSLSPQ